MGRAAHGLARLIARPAQQNAGRAEPTICGLRPDPPKQPIDRPTNWPVKMARPVQKLL